MHRLLRRPALPVESEAGNGLRQPSRQCCRTRDVGRLRADLADAAENDVVEVLAVDAGPVEGRADRVRREVRRMDTREAATTAAHG